jgi:hypothetical protein
MSKSATTEDLSGLHKEVAETLKQDLTRDIPELSDDDEPETKVLKLRMQELVLKLRHDARAHAITFLKNNNITAATGNEEMESLAKALEEQRQRRASNGAIPQQALDDAAAEYGARLQ